MNIFHLSDDPIESAKWMVDKHVVKMIVESAQLLSTSHRVLDGVQYEARTKSGRSCKRWFLSDDREHYLYAATHVNHPSAVWVRQSVENYLWLVDHMYALLDEYRHRYSKIHKTTEIAWILQSPPFHLKEWDRTPFISAMDEKYIVSADPIENYRNYYRLGKASIHKWTNRERPFWL